MTSISPGEGKTCYINMESYRADVHSINGLYLAQCFNCKDVSIWDLDRMLWPNAEVTIDPNDDLPDNIKRDFIEAASILDQSPRGAAALARLCIQKICQHQGGDGRNLNSDIAKLVEEGLPSKIQKALDVVRVIGNGSVHPGELDMADDHKTARAILELVNLIANHLITEPEKVDRLYESLPKKNHAAIDRRDTKPRDGGAS